MSVEIAVRVDLSNPGQYFACCGLLELAYRISKGVESWFENGSFRLRGATTAEDLMTAIRECEIANIMTEEQLARRESLRQMGKKALKANPALDEEKKALDGIWRESPVLFGQPFSLRVDWYLDGRSGGARFKTWAGQQSIIDIVTGLRAVIPPPETEAGRWLEAISTSDCMPLNFDSNLGGAGADVDIGFSFDPLKPIGLRVSMRPAIELLAFVGLQRFRPAVLDDEWEYGVWSQPISAELGALASCGAVRRAADRHFRFQMLYRTKYLKSFLPARPV